MSKAIEAIEEAFLREDAYTVTLEHLAGEGVVAITVSDLEGVAAEGECDWGEDENLGESIERIVNRAIAQSCHRAEQAERREIAS